jgi:cytochrome c peroxidase
VLLPYTLKQIDTQPFAGIEYSADLSKAPARFPANRIGGVGVPLFSDLKHHDMGEGLSEHFRLNDAVGNRTFITTKLWGVADSAPYLHDGRAHTLGEAIAAHGGEAQAARDAFLDLSTAQRDELVGFLSTLRAPRSPNKDVVPGQTRRR